MEDLQNTPYAQGIRAILLGESHSAFQYADRLLKSLIQNEKDCKAWSKETAFELFDIIKLHVLQPQTALDPFDNVMEWRQVADFCLALLQLPLRPNVSIEFVCQIVNTLYLRLQPLQKLHDEEAGGSVLQPRMSVLKARPLDGSVLSGRDLGRLLDANPNILFGDICYFLDGEELLQMQATQEEGVSSIAPLEEQRKIKGQKLIDQGLSFMQEKKYEAALDQFKKASQFRLSAESLNFMAWAYSQLGRQELAKEHCLKAIECDGEYGPAYNDYGVYLMNEGHNVQALKWFAQAKLAPKYENREFPFINCGRIYMQEQQYSMALKEFSQAMKLAPQHRQLKETVSKLARALIRQSQRDMSGADIKEQPLPN